MSIDKLGLCLTCLYFIFFKCSSISILSITKLWNLTMSIFHFICEKKKKITNFMSSDRASVHVSKMRPNSKIKLSLKNFFDCISLIKEL